MHENLQGKTRPEVGRHIKLYLIFHGKNFTLTAITLAIKIKEILSPFLGAFYGLFRAKSTGLD